MPGNTFIPAHIESEGSFLQEFSINANLMEKDAQGLKSRVSKHAICIQFRLKT
jgi:hypothetical protein